MRTLSHFVSGFIIIIYFSRYDAVGTHIRRKETKLRRKSGRTYGFIGCRLLALLVCGSYAFRESTAYAWRRGQAGEARYGSQVGFWKSQTKCEEVKESSRGKSLIG